MKNTLYAKYISEREGSEIIERPNGFLTYKFLGEECFIPNMFVEKEFRKAGVGHGMIDELSRIAAAAGCKLITANVSVADRNSSSTLIGALMIGFRVVSADRNVMVIAKTIGGD